MDTISDNLNRINLITDAPNKGFTMTFPNRVTVSIRWGSFNYSDGRTNEILLVVSSVKLPYNQ